jgi:hypothetical protein
LTVDISFCACQFNKNPLGGILEVLLNSSVQLFTPERYFLAPALRVSKALVAFWRHLEIGCAFQPDTKGEAVDTHYRWFPKGKKHLSVLLGFNGNFLITLTGISSTDHVGQSLYIANANIESVNAR